MIDILEVIRDLDIDILSAQWWLVDTQITNLEAEYQEAITDIEADKITDEINLYKNLLSLIEDLKEYCVKEKAV